MQELVFTPSTVVILAVIIACVVWAVHRIVHRGLCDSGDYCDKCSERAKSDSNYSGSCPSCNVADKMVADMKRSLK